MNLEEDLLTVVYYSVFIIAIVFLPVFSELWVNFDWTTLMFTNRTQSLEYNIAQVYLLSFVVIALVIFYLIMLRIIGG